MSDWSPREFEELLHKLGQVIHEDEEGAVVNIGGPEAQLRLLGHLHELLARAWAAGDDTSATAMAWLAAQVARILHLEAMGRLEHRAQQARRN